MRKFLFMFLLITTSVFADVNLGNVNEGSNTLTISWECPSNGVCPEPEKELVSMPVNTHAVLHSREAPIKGYEYCADCHKDGGEAVTGTYSGEQVGLCSQYNFAYPGNYAYHPVSGLVLTDPVSGKEIVSGGKVAIYNAGTTVRCKDCHYPHATRTKVEDFMIHEGCKDCHGRDKD